MLPLLEQQDLTPEQQKAIACGKQAKVKLVNSNARLVVRIANKYRNQGLDFFDLVQEGMLGAIDAAEHFDPDKGYRFSTYAWWKISHRIKRSISNIGNPVRVPTNFHAKLGQIKYYYRQFKLENGRFPTTAEVCREFEIDPIRLGQLLNAFRSFTSLDAPILEDGGTIDLPAPETPDPLASAEVEHILKHLSDRERQVLILTYGLNGQMEQSQQAIAQHLGVSSSYVRQIHKKCISRLRKEFSESGV
jgi:RNA polymerase sigma factor (sigma-70 family)